MSVLYLLVSGNIVPAMAAASRGNGVTKVLALEFYGRRFVEDHNGGFIGRPMAVHGSGDDQTYSKSTLN